MTYPRRIAWGILIYNTFGKRIRKRIKVSTIHNLHMHTFEKMDNRMDHNSKKKILK